MKKFLVLLMLLGCNRGREVIITGDAIPVMNANSFSDDAIADKTKKVWDQNGKLISHYAEDGALIINEGVNPCNLTPEGDCCCGHSMWPDGRRKEVNACNDCAEVGGNGLCGSGKKCCCCQH